MSSILIIGGGILGACAAYYLSKADYKVTVLEKGDLVSGASGGNSGEISLVDRIEPWHMHAALSSLNVYRYWNKFHDIEFEETGCCTLLHNKLQYEKMFPVSKKLESYQIPVYYYVSKRMLEIEPMIDYTTAHSLAYCPLEAKLNPLFTALSFFDEASKLGATIHTNTQVTGFEIKNKRITAVHTPKGNFSGDIVINAAGAWSTSIAQFCGINLPMLFHRGTALISAPIQKSIYTSIVDGNYLMRGKEYFQKRSIVVGANQCKHGGLVISQATENTELDNKDVGIQGLCEVAKKFVYHFPSLSKVEILRAWSAVTPYTLDGLPIFGFCLEVHNFFTIAGFKGAFAVAPTVGQNVVRALGENFIWENGAFSPNRATKA